MSAIAGIWHWGGRSNTGTDCARMLAAQEIYGPHDGRQWSGESIALGRRLYRLLAEDVHDCQQLVRRDGRLVLAAALRIDNRDELIRDLALPAERARVSSDADVLLEGLVRWDEAALDRLVGDFAFALWDRRAQKLLLARDFAGMRPLHYHCGEGFFAFASMPKGLHALPDIPYATNRRAVAEHVAIMPGNDSSTLFQG